MLACSLTIEVRGRMESGGLEEVGERIKIYSASPPPRLPPAPVSLEQSCVDLHLSSFGEEKRKRKRRLSHVPYSFQQTIVGLFFF